MLGEPTYAEGGRIPYQTGAIVDTAAGPFAGAKAAAITEAQGRSVPFKNYYVGANPTAEQAAFMQEKGAAPLHQRQKVLERLQRNQPTGPSLFERWGQHAPVSQAMKGETGMGVIPEYGLQTGADFQTKFSNVNPKVSATLAAGYQLGQEGLRALNPFGGTFLDFPGAFKTAQEQATQNIEGILAADTGTLTAEQLAARNKYLASQGQPTETMAEVAATPTPDVTKPTMADVAGPAIPEYYRKNPADYDYDKFKQAYAKALDARYGTGQGGGTTTIGPEGQIQTSFGSWDPSRTYSAYMSDTRTSGSGPFYDPNNPDERYMTMAPVMKSMYGAPGAGKAYFNSGGLAGLLGE